MHKARDVPAPLASALLAYTSIWNPRREVEASAGPAGTAVGLRVKWWGKETSDVVVYIADAQGGGAWCDLGTCAFLLLQRLAGFRDTG